MVMHAASVVNRSRKDSEGFSAYRRWKGREFTKPVAEFGECVLYAPADSAGKDKFDVRWREGVWLGVRMESGESLIGTDGGVVKARDFRRKAENGGRWSVAEFDKFVGFPWEPYPGAKGGFELIKGASADRARGVHGDCEGQKRMHEEEVPNQEG
jgi:hypothetical protein